MAWRSRITNHKSLIAVSILALLVGLLTPLLNVQADTQNFNSIGDSDLRPGLPNQNYGSEIIMDVNNDRDGIVRFNLSSIPAGSTVTSATLTLVVTAINGSNGRNWGVNRVLVNWDESTVTWNNPGSTAGTHFASSPTHTITIAATGTYNWNVTTDVAAFVGGTATNYGWRIIWVSNVSGTLYQMDVGTKENATPSNRPTLSVTYTPPDTTPPVITNIQASNITQTTAKITWNTNEPATSQVEYGKTTSYGSQTSLDPDLVTSHTVNLSGLEAGTLYHYRVKSKDASNNLAVSSDKTFTTEAGPDTTPPVISSIQATNISQTGATLTWNTDEPATSQVEYGTTQSYGKSTSLDSSLVTFHSVGLSGLTADTTYHYRVKSKDANNNLRTSGDKTFKTAGAPLPPEEVKTALPGTPKVEAPKIEADKTPPKVSLSVPKPNPTKSPLTTFTGSTTEETGIVSALQFSLNGGQSWHPIKEIKGLGTKKASFTFTTPYLEDGNYEVVIRVFDNSDNIGLSPVRVLVVDVLPPLVGGHIATLGPQVLTPDRNGFVAALVGSEQEIILSAVGGPTKVEILLGEETFPLAYSRDTRLWSGNVRFSEVGAHDLQVVAEDGARNKTDRFLGSALVQPGGEVLDAETGKPIEKAEVYLYFFEEVTKNWVLWNAPSFGLENPNLTDKKGQYSFFVPPGRYYLSVRAPGYRTVASEIVELERGSLLGFVFRLPPRPYLKIPFFDLTIHLPSFLDLLVAGREEIGPPVTVPEPRTLRVGDKIPPFTLPDLRGKQISSKDLIKGKLFLTFGSVWSPTFSEQALILSALAERKTPFYVVFLQEKATAVETFLKRGGYSFPSLIDKTGALAKSYKVLTLPQHLFIEDGVIQRIEMGVLEEEKLLEGLQR